MSKESIIAFHKQKQSHWLQDLRQATFDKLESLALPKLSVLNSTVGISVMERLLKMNHQQMYLILQRLETTLNWSK